MATIDTQFEEHLRDEVEFARAITALLLAARLEEAENRAEDALNRILDGRDRRGSERSA